MKGHTMSDIDNLSYWDFLNIMEYTNKKAEKSSGKTSYSKLNKSQQGMIEKRKASLKREGKM